MRRTVVSSFVFTPSSSSDYSQSANHEASKGFDISIVNDAEDSVACRRFDLLYISNDKATRIILEASNFVEHLFYTDDDHHHHHPKKHVNQVVLKLSSMSSASSNIGEQLIWHKYTDIGVIVHSSPNKQVGHFFLQIRPSIMEHAKHGLDLAILRGMTRVWIWDGETRAPPELIDGMVEYTRMVAERSFGHMKSYGTVTGAKQPECDKFWWKGKDPEVVAQLLKYFEGRSKGFIQRLNGAIKDKWHDQMVDDALGMPLQYFCGSYKFSNYSF